MRLSPATLAGLQTYMYEVTDAERIPREAPEPDTQTVYVCPGCSEWHEYEADAKACCADEADDAEYRIACPVCGVPNDSALEATDCCLWKDIDSATRYRIARAVEMGSTWAEQLQREQHAN